LFDPDPATVLLNVVTVASVTKARAPAPAADALGRADTSHSTEGDGHISQL